MMINNGKLRIVEIDSVDDSLILTRATTGSMNDRRSYLHREGWRIFNPNFVVDSCFNLLLGV
jgi:hypothetical protein